MPQIKCFKNTILYNCLKEEVLWEYNSTELPKRKVWEFNSTELPLENILRIKFRIIASKEIFWEYNSVELPQREIWWKYNFGELPKKNYFENTIPQNCLKRLLYNTTSKNCLEGNILRIQFCGIASKRKCWNTTPKSFPKRMPGGNAIPQNCLKENVVGCNIRKVL